MNHYCKKWVVWMSAIGLTNFQGSPGDLKVWQCYVMMPPWKWRFQTNFSLMEISTYLAIVVFFGAFLNVVVRSNEDARVEEMMAKLEEIASAVSVYQHNTACVPNKLSVLFNKKMAGATNNFCGTDTTAQYGNHPYLSSMPTDGGAGVLPGQAGFPGTRILIRRNLPGTSSKHYALEVYHFGGGLYPVLSACNGVDYSNEPISNLPHDFSHGVSCV
jgi:hypothetical protein